MSRCSRKLETKMYALRLTRSQVHLALSKTIANQNGDLILNNCRHSSMLAWKIYDSLDNQSEISIRSKLKCTETKIPPISTPSDVLVKIHSTSVNPLDVRMCYGYGRRILDLLDIATNFETRITNDRFPLTLGRDFSGEVVATGPCARVHLKPGDLVFGAVEPQRSGAHAEFVSVPSHSLTKKPNNLSHQEAASIPFIALTGYSAVSTFGGLNQTNCQRKQALVLGGSGGVGSFAIQLLKFWGANVTATCSEEKIEWLENTLFVDQAIDYCDLSQMDSLHGRFDFVLDCGDYERTNREHHDIVKNGLELLRPYSQSVYVTLSPPILRNTDRHGLIVGSAETALSAVADTLMSLTSLNSARWAVYLPNKSALDYISGLYEDGALAPLVHSVFTFDQMPDAYEELQSGATRGKVVVDTTKSQQRKSENDSFGGQ